MEIQIGEMAELQGISNQTLHHYDKIGLLKPKINNINGYRFYTQEDIIRLDSILSLKSSGMSLMSIKQYLELTDPISAAELLKQQSEILEEKIEHMKQIKAQLDNRLNLVNKFMYIDKNKGFTELDTINLAVIDVPVNCDNLTIEKTIKKLFVHVKKLDSNQFLDLGAIIKKESYISIDNNEVEIKSFMIPLTKTYPNSIYFRKSKPGRYAYTYYTGYYSGSKNSYNSLLKYINKSGYSVTGNSMEFPVIDTLLTQDPSLLVTKILIPVKPITNL